MNHTLFVVLAYLLIWLILFGYIWNILKKQEKLSREIESLKSELRRK